MATYATIPSRFVSGIFVTLLLLFLVVNPTPLQATNFDIAWNAADCVPPPVNFTFSSFMAFGVVRTIITNNGSVPASITGFHIHWIDRNPAMSLELVTIGGSGPFDPLTTRMWQGADTTPPTVSSGEGTWLTDYVLAAGATVSMYVDFGGASGTLSSAFGVTLADFNGTTLSFGCPNAPPVAADDAFSTLVNTPLTVSAADLLANDSDPDGNPLTIVGAQATSIVPGTIALNNDGTATFYPRENFTGVATAIYTISDGRGGTNTATVTVTVSPP